MNPQDQQTPKVREIHNPLAVMQPGEEIIFNIKRHPVGIIGTYIASGFILIVVAVLSFIAAPDVLTSYSRSEVIGISTVVFLVVAVLVVGFVAIANKVYWGNGWILTSDSVTQITQNSLFDKQSSQLSLGNLEDVTAEKRGILAHMFNFGNLRVETAGERSKFQFPFCPNPEYYAQKVLNERERFEQGRQNEARVDSNQQQMPPDPTGQNNTVQQAPPAFRIADQPPSANPGDGNINSQQ